MENRAHAFAAGIFVVLVSLAIAVSVWWLSGKREATKPLLLVATYNINGLNVQSQVRYRGFRAGKVESIQLDPANPHRILVQANVAENVPITNRTKAELNTQGVTGLAYIQLDDDGEPGLPPSVDAAGVPILNLRKANLEAIADSATVLLGRVNQLADKFNLILSDANLAALSKTLAHLEAASGGLNKSMQEAPKLLADLRKAVNQENLARLQSILTKLDQASGEAKPLVQEARRLVSDMAAMARQVDALALSLSGDQRDFTTATVPQFNRLAQDLSANSRQLARVLERLERSPQSVLYGTTPARPGPGEPGFVLEAKGQ